MEKLIMFGAEDLTSPEAAIKLEEKLLPFRKQMVTY
jgi:hypothetical protein